MTLYVQQRADLTLSHRWTALEASSMWIEGYARSNSRNFRLTVLSFLHVFRIP
jgi:hypothetical protein